MVRHLPIKISTESATAGFSLLRKTLRKDYSQEKL
jgi:hypothetical protein